MRELNKLIERYGQLITLSEQLSKLAGQATSQTAKYYSDLQEWRIELASHRLRSNRLQKAILDLEDEL